MNIKKEREKLEREIDINELKNSDQYNLGRLEGLKRFEKLIEELKEEILEVIIFENPTEEELCIKLIYKKFYSEENEANKKSES